MNCKAAVFDLDGTLLDTLEDLYFSVNRALAHFALPERTKEEVQAWGRNADGARHTIGKRESFICAVPTIF